MVVRVDARTTMAPTWVDAAHSDVPSHVAPAVTGAWSWRTGGCHSQAASPNAVNDPPMTKTPSAPHRYRSIRPRLAPSKPTRRSVARAGSASMLAMEVVVVPSVVTA
jgi:hypothetical protein